MIAFIRLVTQRPVGVTIVSFAVAVLGLVSLERLAIDLLPSVDVPWVSVVTAYEGVAPEEIETLITRPIEQATSSVQGVHRIEATSAEGLSRVQLQFTWGKDVDQALNDVRVALEGVRRRLPEDADPPSANKFDLASVPILHLGVTGDLDPRKLKHLAEDQLSRALERLPGVASVDARGGRDREIQVSLQSNRLAAFGISAEQVAAALARENRTVSAGDVKEGGSQVVIRTAGEYASVEDIGATVVTSRDGTPVLVRDLGAVVDSIRRVRSELYIDGNPGIELRVFKQAGANTVEVATSVHQEVERLNQQYRGRARLAVFWDSADYIRAAVDGVWRSALVGAGLAVLVLLFFLRSWRATLVVTTAIPLSLLATFALAYGQGMTLNLISLGGLALGIGMLVDGAVVILESIYRKRSLGAAPVTAAVEGTREVATAVIAGTLTTVAVFIPVVFIEDLAGVIFREMALVVTFALFCALLVALTLVPMLSGFLLGRSTTSRESRFGRAIGQGFERLDGWYARVIDVSLEAPWAVVVGAVVLLGSSVVLTSRVGVELMPESDEGRIDADIEFPVGTPLETTDALLRSAEKRALAVLRPGELSHVITSVGPENWWRPGGSNEGEVELMLAPASQRERSVLEIQRVVEAALADLPGAKSRIRAVGSNILSRIIRRGGDRLSLEILGHDLGTADALAEEVSGMLREVPGVTYARAERELGQIEQTLVVDRQRASELGLGSSEVAATVEHYVLGRVATRFRDQGDEFDIRVQLAPEERLRLGQLSDLPIIGKAGTTVPLHSLVTIQERRGPSSISRVNQERSLRVDAGLGARALGDVAADVSRKLSELEVPEGFSVRLGGELASQAETFKNLLIGILLSLFLVYATMAVQFESVRFPLVIMAAVPFAFIGVALALVVTGTTFNMNSFLGTILLIGIVVNNAIVLVDYTNLMRQQGMGLRESLIAAGQRRLRPILMTTLTTLLGLLPLAVGVSEGSEMQAPLARTIIGGFTTSTLVTLILIPCLYFILERKREARAARTSVLTPAASVGE